MVLTYLQWPGIRKISLYSVLCNQFRAIIVWFYIKSQYDFHLFRLLCSAGCHSLTVHFEIDSLRIASSSSSHACLPACWRKNMFVLWRLIPIRFGFRLPFLWFLYCLVGISLPFGVDHSDGLEQASAILIFIFRGFPCAYSGLISCNSRDHQSASMFIG